MITKSILDSIAQHENNRKLLNVFLHDYRHMTDAIARRELIEVLVNRRIFYVPTSSYLSKFFGETVVREFSEYYRGGKCMLTGSVCIPIETVSNDFLGFILNNPQSPVKYRYPMNNTYKKSNYIQISADNYLNAIKLGFIFIVEGVFDELSLTSVGMPAAALSGSSLTYDTAQWLDVIPTKVICSDEDAAGSRLLNSCYKTFTGNVICTKLPTKDIDEFLRLSENRDKLKSKVEQARSYNFMERMINLCK